MRIASITALAVSITGSGTGCSSGNSAISSAAKISATISSVSCDTGLGAVSDACHSNDSNTPTETSPVSPKNTSDWVSCISSSMTLSCSKASASITSLCICAKISSAGRFLVSCNIGAIKLRVISSSLVGTGPNTSRRPSANSFCRLMVSYSPIPTCFTSISSSTTSWSLGSSSFLRTAVCISYFAC